MKLYKLQTGNGEYFVVANHPTEAEEKLSVYFNEADYGYNSNRKVTDIALLAESTNDVKFITGKNLVL